MPQTFSADVEVLPISRERPDGNCAFSAINQYKQCELREFALHQQHELCIYSGAMRITRIAAVLLVLTSGLLTAQQAGVTQDRVSAKLRELYPDNADAKKEISEALDAAAKEHKRVLLVFGANWCFDCFALDYRFHQANIQPIVEKNYRVVHVDIGQRDKN